MSHSDQENNTDSAFLDMITNCVGILIILVMVVGQRAKDIPALLAQQKLSEETEEAQRQVASVEQDISRVDEQLERVDSELAARASERDDLQTILTGLERQLASRRAALGQTSRDEYDAARDLALANAEIARVERERQQTPTTVVSKTVTIENYPTPLGKTVDGREAHFQLSGGRIVFVPIEALVERLQSTLREQFSRFDSPREAEDTLEAIGGFRARYGVEKVDNTRVGVSFVQFLPVSSQLGEPMAEALGRQSKFRDRMAMLSPRQYTITVWVYPDSFDEFRQLKKELYSQGYAVAARPLPQGMPIGASPQGSKSSAQ